MTNEVTREVKLPEEAGLWEKISEIVDGFWLAEPVSVREFEKFLRNIKIEVLAVESQAQAREEETWNAAWDAAVQEYECDDPDTTEKCAAHYVKYKEWKKEPGHD